jgi:hypothetical protein
MQIKTQPIKEAIELKSSGIAFDVYNNGAKRIGDLAITKNGLIWSNGTPATKGMTVKWDDFISWMQTRTQAPARAPQQARTLAAAQTRSASKSKAAPAAAAKTGNAVKAKKPAAAKLNASAKTASKKAH